MSADQPPLFTSTLGLGGHRWTPTLDDVRTPTPASASHPDTSHEAAASLDPAALRPVHRWLLEQLAAISADEGRTDEALLDRYHRLPVGAVSFRTSPSGLRARRSELRDAGLVSDSGRRVRIRSGRRAIVWQLTAAGAEQVAHG